MSAEIRIRASEEEQKRLDEIAKKFHYQFKSSFIIDAINEKAGEEVLNSKRKRGDYNHKRPAQKAREEAEKAGIMATKDNINHIKPAPTEEKPQE